MFDFNKAIEKLQQKLDTVQTDVDQLSTDIQDRANQLSEMEGQVNRLIDRLPEAQRQKFNERLQNRTDDQK